MPLKSVLASITRSSAGVDLAAIVGFGGGNAIVEDGLRAQFGDGLGCDGGPGADDGAAGGVAEAGTRLVTGGKRIAHAGHEIADRGGRDQLRINQHERRAVGERLAAVDDAFVGVDHRQGGAGRVGRGDCGADDDGDFEAGGDAFAGVETFAASDRDQAVEGGVLRLQTCGRALDFGVGTLALEDLDRGFDLQGAQAV